MRNVLFLFFVLSVLISCKEKSKNIAVPPENQDQLLMSVLWYQRSGEMQALYYQGYNIAKISLIEKLSKPVDNKPKAVIMDIDETVLDNSAVEAFQAVNNLPFSDSIWNKWVDQASAEPLPGALEFIKFAESRGVEVFYVTNRSFPNSFNPTIKNLKDKGLPFADSVHLILKKDVSSKKIRRNAIAEKYDILMLIGDNLADFDDVFDVRGEDLAFGEVKNKSNEFGKKFIILPNPMYGGWVNPAVSTQVGGTMGEKIRNVIKSF
jgi:5'-nucleotidase (lipoprotein e(P4) family)